MTDKEKIERIAQILGMNVKAVPISNQANAQKSTNDPDRAKNNKRRVSNEKNFTQK
ncbi:MAG: hypothetical protein OH335_04805 [Candidatus Parvarchaeota archaeon]|nr:hypothetical protein [Candidatus Jingweiarchaeum tengchongense]